MGRGSATPSALAYYDIYWKSGVGIIPVSEPFFAKAGITPSLVEFRGLVDV